MILGTADRRRLRELEADRLRLTAQVLALRRQLWSERARADMAAAQLAAQHNLTERLLKESHTQQDRLITEMVGMKRDGFVPPGPPQAEREPQRDPLPPGVQSALLERAKANSALWNELLSDAYAQLDAGATPEEVSKGILEGGHFNPLAH